MSPIRDWRTVLRHAWSVRLMIAAALLSAIEAVLPLFTDELPRGAAAVLTFVVVGAALVARFVAQPKTIGADDE